MSHAEVEGVLRRAEYSHEQIEDALRGFPDPMDERDCAALDWDSSYQPGPLR